MSTSRFSRQLKFAYALADSYASLTADALLRGDLDYANTLARYYGLAVKFRDSRIWYDWTCTTYKIFSNKFSALYFSDHKESEV